MDAGDRRRKYNKDVYVYEAWHTSKKVKQNHLEAELDDYHLNMRCNEDRENLGSRGVRGYIAVTGITCACGMRDRRTHAWEWFGLDLRALAS